jgi:hypothetical protein
VEGDVGTGGHVAEGECRPVDVGADGTIVHDENSIVERSGGVKKAAKMK